MYFMLVETQQLLYRFNSFPSILQKFRIPVSPDKIEKLHLVSNALVGISELIKSHKSAAASKDYGDPLDRAGWDATWGSSTGTHGVFDDIKNKGALPWAARAAGEGKGRLRLRRNSFSRRKGAAAPEEELLQQKERGGCA
ncbi:hypothetical protein D1007_44335 [Hordeum vulgare]|nr:hypothetical protein D1007_44335 [Hordeum vulgare]